MKFSSLAAVLCVSAPHWLSASAYVAGIYANNGCNSANTNAASFTMIGSSPGGGGASTACIPSPIFNAKSFSMSGCSQLGIAILFADSACQSSNQTTIFVQTACTNFPIGSFLFVEC
ncbi:hypothetical protein CVT26_013022 [Gymnopilus dilepis]|uniref:Cyanovirin-N domain-containing protein n=1 Tax=Gymnopilus dilepis TaxID=231916 RepID=A0A409Y4D4_9AGAR|nr:hypothetical protein CVT26_013022 [Gymnopilus dilepis]